MAYDKLSSYQTQIAQVNGFTVVSYRGTPIVAFNDAQIKLCTGGWKSVTTKRKMNQASHQFGLGYGVYQKAGDWYVIFNGQDIEFDGNIFTIER
jgi:hypothetical protein